MLKKNIIFLLKDFDKNANHIGNFKEKINFKKINLSYLKNLSSQGWKYQSNYLDHDNYLVLEFTRDGKFYDKSFDLVLEINNFYTLETGFDNLIHTNSNIFY